VLCGCRSRFIGVSCILRLTCSIPIVVGRPNEERGPARAESDFLVPSLPPLQNRVAGSDEQSATALFAVGCSGRLLAIVRGEMPCTGLLLVLGSRSLSAALSSSAAPVLPMITVDELRDNATVNGHERCAWEWELRLECGQVGRQAQIDRQAYPHCESSGDGLRLTPWGARSEERHTSATAGSCWLLGVLLTAVVLAYATAASTSDCDFGDSAGRPEEVEGEEPAAPRVPPDDASAMDDGCETAHEPRSPRVAMAAGLHATDMMVDLDAIAGQTSASALLAHVRGGGRAVTLPLKVYLATQWERGNQRLWCRLQHHVAKADWILCTTETCTLFIRRAACPALFELLPDLGEFVGPALGKMEGRVAFARRARGAILTSTLLAALAKVAVDELDERLGHVIYVTVADRLPLAGYALDEDGVSLLAPFGHTGADLLDYFGQHRDPATHLFFVDVAARVPLSSNAVNDAWWQLYRTRSPADRATRPAVVNLGASEIDQYDQHGRNGGSIKLRLSPRRRRQLAEDAIDAHALDARTELHKSRWHGAGFYWTAPVCIFVRQLNTARCMRVAACLASPPALLCTQAERVEQGCATEADLMNLSSNCLAVCLPPYCFPHAHTPCALNSAKAKRYPVVWQVKMYMSLHHQLCENLPRFPPSSPSPLFGLLKVVDSYISVDGARSMNENLLRRHYLRFEATLVFDYSIESPPPADIIARRVCALCSVREVAFPIDAEAMSTTPWLAKVGERHKEFKAALSQVHSKDHFLHKSRIPTAVWVELLGCAAWLLLALGMTSAAIFTASQEQLCQLRHSNAAKDALKDLACPSTPEAMQARRSRLIQAWMAARSTKSRNTGQPKPIQTRQQLRNDIVSWNRANRLVRTSPSGFLPTTGTPIQLLQRLAEAFVTKQLAVEGATAAEERMTSFPGFRTNEVSPAGIPPSEWSSASARGKELLLAAAAMRGSLAKNWFRDRRQLADGLELEERDVHDDERDCESEASIEEMDIVDW